METVAKPAGQGWLSSRSLHVKVAERLFAPTNIAPLVWFRILFGLLLFVEVCRYFAHGWIEDDYIDPTFFFTYYGFGWVHPWPGDGMFYHFAALGVLALAVSLGFAHRLSAFLFFLGFTYVFLLEQTRYLNHFYLVCLYSFLLIFVPAHRACSLDALFWPHLRSGVAPTWALWLLRVQIGIVYFMGGIAKLNPDWLRGQPMGIWLSKRTDFPVIGRYFGEEWMAYLFSYGGLLVDLFLVPLLLWRRTRWLGFCIAVFFNFMNARLFQIGIFPWLSMGAVLLLFIDPARLPKPFPKLWGEPEMGRSSTPPEFRLTRARVLVLSALTAWAVFQVLVPLRHLVLYPDRPEWNEEGHRFAWRMKLRTKRARLQLFAKDPVTSETWRLSLSDYLTDAQIDDCVTDPDMILQLCHHVAKEWHREHGTRLEVRAFSHASLNGRPMTRLIDPEVDLAGQPRSWRHATWIEPLTAPLNPARRRSKEPMDDG